MANLTYNKQSSSSSNYYETSMDVVARANILASAYSVDASSGALKSFHYSTSGTNIPSPPPSPNAASTYEPRFTAVGSRHSARGGAAAYNITGECERLFCETLRAVFLGEGNLALQDSLVMGMPSRNTRFEYRGHGLPRSLPSPMSLSELETESNGYTEQESKGGVREWIEIWDYVGGARFRGFVGGNDAEKALFVFFDEGVIGRDLKHGLMALLELSSSPVFDCSSLVVCLDRNTDSNDTKALLRDLGWVGFELITLGRWTKTEDAISDRWIFLGMDV
ncbi:hypothetical protein B0A49_07162 [Cryomyces minteri]|uniref:Ornithine decarboxylase antizyme n=1 Tax=Cryomyces minteri TaxID=331657 RepID=A0A4U0WRB6_9PEZI|nr:hypothetical protein B0A49_07162 [Cryomyces minteri]